MADASTAPSPPLDIDGIVVDLHTSQASAATAAQALLNENSNASSETGINLKFPILFTSSSESEGEQLDIQRNPFHARIGVGEDAATTTAGSSSPPPNCAICLGRCKNKCVTNSCVHQFCFKCLAEWSKVKAECPLCKQPFRVIIHNFKNDQPEEYVVQTPTVQLPHNPLEVTYQGPLGFSVGPRAFYNFSMRSYPRSHVIPSRGPITFRNYVDHDFGASGSIPSTSVAVEAMPLRQPDFFRREMPAEYGNDVPVGQLWRRYIYDRKLYALPISDITGRFRECSARYYRANPGQIVRLIPFANRDLVCLLRNTNHNVTRVLETLHNGLEVSNILSRSFRRRLQPFLGERTAHFIHELSNFARSPYDMIGYDDNVQYAPQTIGEDQIIEFSSSGGEETNNNNNVNNNNIDEHPTSTSIDDRTSSRRNTRRAQTAASSNTSSSSSFPPMSLLSFTITTTTEGSEAPGVSVAVSAGSRRGHAQVAAINLSTHNRAHNEVVIDLDDVVEVNEGNRSENAGGSTSDVANAGTFIVSDNSTTNNRSTDATLTAAQGSPQIVASIALSTSSSDECEFVLERKPPHLRTPELVSLNSESDSDVVFVEEVKPILAEATYSTSDEGGKKTPTLDTLINEQEQLREHEKHENELQCNGPEASTSTGLRSRTLRRIDTYKRSNINRSESGVPVKRRRTRVPRVAQAAEEYSSDESTSADDCNDSDFDNSKRSRRRGASSSSGLRRGSSNARKCVNLVGRKSRKRTRGSKIKMEIMKEIDGKQQQDSPNEQTRRTPPRQRFIHCNSIKCMTQDPQYSSAKDSSTEEDDKVNLKALQLRLKTSLSDVDAILEEQAINEDINHQTPVFSLRKTTDLNTSKGQNEGMVRKSNGDADTVLIHQLNVASNFLPGNDLDERPSTSAAAAAVRKSVLSSNIHDESETSDANNEPSNTTSLRSSPNSPEQLALERSSYLSCPSPRSTSSNSSMNSFQLPITSQNNQQLNLSDKFSAHFKYSSSSDSSTDTSSSSMTQSSASDTSASEYELN